MKVVSKQIYGLFRTGLYNLHLSLDEAGRLRMDGKELSDSYSELRVSCLWGRVKHTTLMN